MAVLRHSVTVTALTPDRLRELTASAFDLAQTTRDRGEEIVLADGRPVPGVRLVKGRHLRPGARYDIAAADDAHTLTVHVRQWKRGTAVAVETLLASASGEGTARAVLRLRAPGNPQLVDLEGEVGGSGLLRRGSGTAQLDLAAWWAAVAPADRPTVRAPVSARLRHPLALARLHVRPQRAEGGRWQVDVTAVVRGRWLLRPVAALALMVVGRPVRVAFRSAVEEAAGSWDRAVAELQAFGPDDARAHLIRTAARRTPREPPDSPPIR